MFHRFWLRRRRHRRRLLIFPMTGVVLLGRLLLGQVLRLWELLAGAADA